MSVAICLLLALLIGCFAWFLVSIRNAPAGWEDQYGFHFGNQDEDDK